MKIDFKFIKEHYMVLGILLFTVIYIGFFSIAYSSIGDRKSDIDDSPRKEGTDIDNDETNVILRIEQGGRTDALSAKMHTQDSVKDVLEHFREKTGFSYETKAFTDRTAVVEINGVKNSSTMEWKLYQFFDQNDGLAEKELTDFPKVKVTKNAVYILRFTRI